MSMFTAADTLHLLQAELGAPRTDVLDAEEGPGVLERALTRAARRTGATLVVLFVEDEVPPTWLPGAVEPHVLEVAEGLLVAYHVHGRSHGRLAHPVRIRRPWATPDAAPVLSAVEDDLEERLLRPILRAVEWDMPLEVPEPATAAERLLGRHGLLVHDGSRFRPTLAGVVLCASRPSRFVPGCRLEGHANGACLSLYAPLPRIRRRLGLGPTAGLNQVLLSGVVTHAFLHRDWASPEPARLLVDGGELVLRFPGSMAAPQPVNPLLRHLVVSVGWMARKGRALDRVDARLEAHGLPPATVVQEGEEVVLRARVRRRQESARRRLPQTTRHHPPSPRANQETALSRPPTTRQTTRPPPARPPAPKPVPAVELEPEEEPLVDDLVEPEPPDAAPEEPVVEPVPVQPPPPFLGLRDPQDRRDRALQTLEALGEATTRELASALGCSRPVVGKVLKDLVDRGLVRRLTATSRSPYQRYASTSQTATARR